MRKVTFLLVVSLLCVAPLIAQSPNATINGLVLDPSGAAIAGAQIVVVNDATGIQYVTKTNGEGIYVVPNVPPGQYRIQVSNSGFKTIIKPDIVLHVQDALAINFTLPIGAASEIVTVPGGTPLVNTESAAVSTVIDRQFVENLPLNGRSFNTLLQLTAGVLIVPSSSDSGQFSINGQRSNANYFQVDGVSVNFGVGIRGEGMGQNGSGALQAFNAFGGTSSLVSVDAMQEFRVQTSSFAPEYGRAPGGQVSIITRSGTNEFHGDLFDYFRNDVLDANDWFANAAGKSRAAERQNDFGGVFGGPILKDKTFFFLSYEGLRLRQPQARVIQVPSLSLRASAIPATAPYLNAYPLPDPNGPVSANGYTAQFTGNYSNKITADSASLRVDHTFKGRLAIFGRYNWAPSQTVGREPNPHTSLNQLDAIDVDTQTLTLGASGQITSNSINSARLNYSRQVASTVFSLDSLGGGTPPNPSTLIPSPFSVQNGTGFFDSFFVPHYGEGRNSKNREQQWNIVDDLALSTGSHQLKFGVDYRRLLLKQNGIAFDASYGVLDPKQFAAGGNTFFISNEVIRPAETLFPAFSVYAQDSWKIGQRFTLTYGLRWEINPAPSGQHGTTLASWQNVDDPANTVLAPVGTPPWKTTYGNFAPRVGAVFRVTQKGDLVVRGGWGIFYDLGTGLASALNTSFPNLSSLLLFPGIPIPVTNSAAITPLAPSAVPPFTGTVVGFAPNLQLPYSHQWNLAVEKSFLGQQSLTVTYLGQAGRRLLRTEADNPPNNTFDPNSSFVLTLNGSTSDYDAVQVQFRRPMSRHVQALLNYTWSHSIDTSSDDSFFDNSLKVVSAGSSRGSSDFDVRHNVTGALNYEVPSYKKNAFVAKFTENWSLDTVFQARTGFPINIATQGLPIPGANSGGRPDVVPGIPFWLHSPNYPGGQALNPAAFVIPTAARQGTLGRNAVNGFGATQFDVSVQRKFAFNERLALLFRTDAFNIFNHPNFTNPDGTVGPDPTTGNTSFVASNGLATQMLNQGLGGLNPLYQTGGPRSLQISLKLVF